MHKDQGVGEPLMGAAEMGVAGAQLQTGKHGQRTAIATSALSYILLLAGLLAIGACLYMMVVSYSPVPFWDGWIQIQHPAEGGNPVSLDWLWSQYNEHRMPIPKLFLAADLDWLHGTQIFLLSSIFAIQLLQVVILSWAMWVLGGWRGALWRTGTGLAAFCLFCLSQWENLTWGMQVCFLLPGLFASISFVGLLLYWSRHKQPSAHNRYLGLYVLLSIAAALGATWSYANGNLLWPLLLVAAIVLRLPLKIVLSYAIAGALSTALFMNNYLRPPYVIDHARTPINTLKYFAGYFGSSWLGASEHTRAAEAIGLIGFGIAFWFLLGLRSYIANCRAFHIHLILVTLFCLGSGLVTSFGRAGFGVSQAFSSRYQSIALLFWCSLGLLALASITAAKPRSNLALLLPQTVLLLVMLAAAGDAGTPLIRARVRGFRLNATAVSLATEVPDPDELRWAFWKPTYLTYLGKYMRQERLSIFHEPISQVLDEPLQSAFRVAPPGQCSGAVETTANMSPAGIGLPSLRVTGWAWDNVRNQPAAAVIAATNGTITGLGAMGDWRPMNRAPRKWMAANFLGYTAYVRQIGGPIQMYAVLPGSPATACPIASVDQSR